MNLGVNREPQHQTELDRQVGDPSNLLNIQAARELVLHGGAYLADGAAQAIDLK